MIKKILLSIIVCIGLSCLIPCAMSAETNDQAGIVEKIEYKYDVDGVNINQQIVESRVQLKIGHAFSPLLADSSIKALYSSGMFDNITVKADENQNTHGYIVTFFLSPRLKVESMEFAGNTKIKSQNLKKKIATKSGGILSTSELKSDVEKLTKFYNDKGYPYAEISYKLQDSANPCCTNVTFNISEGEKFHIGNINFIGNDVIKRAKLLKAMRTKKWTFMSFLGKSGIYRPTEFSSDINDLKIIFKNHGYLDVEINEKNVVYKKRGNTLDIDIYVAPGQKYYIGNITINGNALYSEKQINGVMIIKEDGVFSPKKIEDSAEKIRDLYGRSGYISTGVSIVRKPNLESGKIDLVFAISEAGKCFVNEIEIRGNSKTKNKVILRELALAPGDQFDLVRMKNSRARLMNTGYFSYVDISPVDTKVSERKNLRVEVKEADTGKIGLGGGISTGGEIVGFVEFSQRNFDLSSKNKKFQGGGQKFRSRLQIGKRMTSVDINFEEPWWYDRELAVGGDLFFHKRDYDKDSKDYSGAGYDESRLGTEIYIKKRIYELWEGRLAYHLENVKIYNISRNAPRCFFDEEGNTSVSKILFSLERDTRDNFIYPTQGSKIGLDTELAGGPCFGETKYVKLSLSAVKHWLTFETAEQVLSVIGKTGTVTPYGGDTTPFFDRFYLGGSSLMKGFKSHDIGPSENETGIGGNTFAYASAEYSVRIANPLRIYAFAEAGFVNETKWNFSTKRYNTDVGIGLKISMMGMPLRLDFGFPIHGERDNKHGMRFNYSFGVAF